MLMLLPKCVMTHAPGEWHEAAGAPDFAKLSAERCPGALEWLSRKAGPLPVIKLSGDAAEPDLGPLLPHAHGRVLRGDRQRARDRVALLGLILVTRVPPPGSNRPGSGPFLAVEDAEPSAP